MSRHELLSPEGLRIDGRRWNELRRFEARLSTTTAADGSSYVEWGNTKIICSVSGPNEPKNGANRSQDRATVTVEVCFAAFSGNERKKRAKSDRRIQEMQTALQRTFAEAILTNLHPRSEIVITLHILSQDGSVLATCINACTLALIDAGIPMSDYVVACTAGSHSARSGNNPEVEGEGPLLDMNNVEESDLPGVTIATIGNSEKITLLQLETKVRLERLEGMMAVALDGCGKLKEIMDDIVRTHGNEMARRGAL